MILGRPLGHVIAFLCWVSRGVMLRNIFQRAPRTTLGYDDPHRHGAKGDPSAGDLQSCTGWGMREQGLSPFGPHKP